MASTESRWPPIDARLALPAAFAWAALAVAVAFPDSLLGAAVVAWALAGLTGASAVAVVGWRRVLTTASVALGVTALLLTSAAAQQPQRSPEILEEAAESSRHVRLLVVLDEVTDASGTRVLGTAVEAAVGDVTVTGIAAPLVLFDVRVPEGCCELGATVSVAGTVATTLPGDRAAFLVFARGGADAVRAPPWLLQWSNALRSGFSDATSGLPGEGGDLLPGLAIGDTSAVSDALDQAMIDTALSHLTAVSGANVAIRPVQGLL